MQPQKTLYVLIVEDDFMVSEIIKKELESLGHIVAGKAHDGLQAVKMTQSLQPDVILMDIEMPDMNGLEAAQQIYQACPTPVVMLTAYDSPDLVEQAGAAGAGAYLLKMPGAREIERAITIAMARFDDMMALRRLNAELQSRNEKLQKAQDEIKTLKRILPICANCKKIRDDNDYWHEVADYLHKHSELKFTHGICPDCAKKLYPDLYDDDAD